MIKIDKKYIRLLNEKNIPHLRIIEYGYDFFAEMIFDNDILNNSLYYGIKILENGNCKKDIFNKEGKKIASYTSEVIDIVDNLELNYALSMSIVKNPKIIRDIPKELFKVYPNFNKMLKLVTKSIEKTKNKNYEEYIEEKKKNQTDTERKK